MHRKTLHIISGIPRVDVYEPTHDIARYIE